MHVFNGQVEDLLSMLGSDPHLAQDPKAETQNLGGAPTLDDFKVYISQYVSDHDQLSQEHPTITQLSNFNTIDEIENMLRQKLDYCDDCMLKLYRGFASGDGEGTGCGCARCQGEDSEEETTDINPPPGGG